jgi:hypothetical protein
VTDGGRKWDNSVPLTYRDKWDNRDKIELSHPPAGGKPPLRALASSRVVDPCSWVRTTLSGWLGFMPKPTLAMDRQTRMLSRGSAGLRPAPRHGLWRTDESNNPGCRVPSHLLVQPTVQGGAA